MQAADMALEHMASSAIGSYGPGGFCLAMRIGAASGDREQAMRL